MKPALRSDSDELLNITDFMNGQFELVTAVRHVWVRLFCCLELTVAEDGRWRQQSGASWPHEHLCLSTSQCDRTFSVPVTTQLQKLINMSVWISSGSARPAEEK